MRFSWNFMVERHIVNVPTEAEWHLFSTLDDSDMPVIYLETAKQQYLIAHGFEYIHTFGDQGLDASHVSRFYYCVVDEVYDRLQDEPSEYLDISLIMQEILDEFWPEWCAKGYVTQDSVPTEFIS